MWIVLAILLGVALLFSCCGFKKFVWFMSIGYGLAVCGIGIALLVLGYTGFGFVQTNGMSYPALVLAILLILYGLRLSGFLIYREAKSVSYRKTLAAVSGKDEKKMPVFVKATIWLCVIVLYVAEASPIMYRITGGVNYNVTGSVLDLIFPIVGGAIMLIGLVIETVADLQKSAAKKKNPHRFVDTGLYRFVRCPNYLGEILFWTGVLVSGGSAMNTWWMWVIAVIGWILIVYVMVSGAKRLEKRQTKNYGEDPEYQAYVKKTPILMHLIPVKSLINVKWIV
jgi:steroid 5-alpha reductase family enzyme